MKRSQLIPLLAILAIFLVTSVSAFSLYDFFGNSFVGNVIDEDSGIDGSIAGVDLEIEGESDIVEPIDGDVLGVITSEIGDVDYIVEPIETIGDSIGPIESDYPVRPTTDFKQIFGEGLEGFDDEFLVNEGDVENSDKGSIFGSIGSFIQDIFGLD